MALKILYYAALACDFFIAAVCLLGFVWVVYALFWGNKEFQDKESNDN